VTRCGHRVWRAWRSRGLHHPALALVAPVKRGRSCWITPGHRPAERNASAAAGPYVVTTRRTQGTQTLVGLRGAPGCCPGPARNDRVRAVRGPARCLFFRCMR
jgi:hypothetical protein